MVSHTTPSPASLASHLLWTPHRGPLPAFPSQLPGRPRAPGPPHMHIRRHIFRLAHTLNPSAILTLESLLIKSNGLFESLTLLNPLQWLPVPLEEALNHSQQESTSPTGFHPALQQTEPPPDSAPVHPSAGSGSPAHPHPWSSTQMSPPQTGLQAIPPSHLQHNTCTFHSPSRHLEFSGLFLCTPVSLSPGSAP